MLSRSLLSALLISGAAIVASLDATSLANGFLQVAGGVARSQANANMNVNKVISRTSNLYKLSSTAVFVTTKTFLSTNVTSGSLAGLVNLNFTNNVIVVSATPIPYAVSAQSSITFNPSSLSLSEQSYGVVFPAAVEYNETNGVDGFQLGHDVTAQIIDLRSNYGNIFQKILGAFEALTTTTEIWPADVNNTANATVHVASACNTGKTNARGFCFTFRFSSSTYVRDGVTYLPDSVKVDVLANLTSFNTNGRLALLSSFVSTSDTLTLGDFHLAVENTIQAAQKVGGVALVTPDFAAFAKVNSVNSSLSVSNGTVSNFTSTEGAGYLNYARTAIQTSANGNQTVAVNAEVVFNATVTNSISGTIDTVAYNTLSATFDFMNSASANLQYIVFSFLAPSNGAQSLLWDPEIGTTSVVPANVVVGGSASGLSAGAIAGIVIGVLAVVGVAGFFGYRALRKTKKNPFLG